MKMGVGIIGCGQISERYLANLVQFDNVSVVMCADIDESRARERATQFGIPECASVETLLASPTVDVVVNLTIPAVHADISLRALAAGKHVYSEKPLATSLAEGKEILGEAAKRGLRVACAPDTMLGAGFQTARKAVDNGFIGRPVAATAFMVGHGPEAWHNNPFFFYEPGAGPLYDMGPYYLSSLVCLMGPAVRVCAISGKGFNERVAGCEAHKGAVIKVRTPTHVAGSIEFACGAIATLITSFDVWGAHLPRIEVYGSESSITVPDPNSFSGEVTVLDRESKEWVPVPVTHAYAENSRGVGVAEMVQAIAENRPHRASGAVALHVLEIMESLLRSSVESCHISLTTTCQRPQAMPEKLTEYVYCQ